MLNAYAQRLLRDTQVTRQKTMRSDYWSEIQAGPYSQRAQRALEEEGPGGVADKLILKRAKTSLERRARRLLPAKFVATAFDGPAFAAESTSETQNMVINMMQSSGAQQKHTWLYNPRAYFRMFVEGEDLCGLCLAMYPQEDGEAKPGAETACSQCGARRYAKKTISSANMTSSPEGRSLARNDDYLYTGSKSVDRQRPLLRGICDVDEPTTFILAHAVFRLRAPVRSWKRLGPKHMLWNEALVDAKEWAGRLRETARRPTIASLAGCDFEGKVGMPAALADKVRQFLVTLEMEIRLLNRPDALTRHARRQSRRQLQGERDAGGGAAGGGRAGKAGRDAEEEEDPQEQWDRKQRARAPILLQNPVPIMSRVPASFANAGGYFPRLSSRGNMK